MVFPHGGIVPLGSPTERPRFSVIFENARHRDIIIKSDAYQTLPGNSKNDGSMKKKD